MAMATVYTLQNADFSTADLPNINPFINKTTLDFAFDFRKRANRLNDINAKHADLVPKRNDIVLNQKSIVDATIVKDADNGLGITLELGYLETDVPTANIPIDGSSKFSIMVVGGYSGTPFPPSKILGGAASIANLYDYGTGVSNKGFAIEATKSVVGGRIKAHSTNLYDAIVTARKCFIVLTYDGTIWTLHNKTLGTKQTKTNTQLGISSAIVADKTYVSNLVFGHYHTANTGAALYPSLYQVARWTSVLTDAEIEQQYKLSKNALAGLDI